MNFNGKKKTLLKIEVGAPNLGVLILRETF